MKFIKGVLFIILISLVLLSIGWLYFLFVEWFIDLSFFWMIVTFLIISSLLWGLLKMIIGFVLFGLMQISPGWRFGKWTTRLLSIIWGVAVIFDTIFLYLEYEMFSLLGWGLLSLIIIQIVILVNQFFASYVDNT